MKIDVSCELGRLLVYIADVATAIRMNSSYLGDYESRDQYEMWLNVMWLADSLHSLDRLGHALQSDDNKEIVTACDSLLSYYRMFTDGTDSNNLKGDPKTIFDRYGHLCRPGDAMAVFTNIRDKALAVERRMST